MPAVSAVGYASAKHVTKEQAEWISLRATPSELYEVGIESLLRQNAARARAVIDLARDRAVRIVDGRAVIDPSDPFEMTALSLLIQTRSFLRDEREEIPAPVDTDPYSKCAARAPGGVGDCAVTDCTVYSRRDEPNAAASPENGFACLLNETKPPPIRPGQPYPASSRDIPG